MKEDPFKKGRPSQKPLSLAEKLSISLEKKQLLKQNQEKKKLEKEMEEHQQKVKAQLMKSLEEQYLKKSLLNRVKAILNKLKQKLLLLMRK